MSVIKLPGTIDIHVHLREPSGNNAENIGSGSLAAASGGYSLVCDMPNNPGNPTWTTDKIKEKLSIAEKSAKTKVLFYAGSQPESNNLNELAGMAKAGAIGLKLYGAPTTGNDNDYTAKDFEQIVAKWHEVAPDKPIMLHAGANNIKDMIELVTIKYSHRLHICHVHKSDEVALVKNYKQKGSKITCGVCPHHFLKTSHETIGQGWFARMQPPLPDQTGAKALLDLLASGDIDIIESDHAPHSIESKLKAEIDNPKAIHDPSHKTCFGVPGIEHILPMMLNLVRKNILTLDRLIDAVHTKPLEVLGLTKDQFDPEQNWSEWDISASSISRIGEKDVISNTKWSPYTGYTAGGKLIKLVVDGKIILENK